MRKESAHRKPIHTTPIPRRGAKMRAEKRAELFQITPVRAHGIR
jgi:hypothetical protein